MPVAGLRWWPPGRRRPRRSTPRDDHALGDLLREEIGELLGRPRGGRVGLRCEEVAAEHLLRAHARSTRRCARRWSATAPRTGCTSRPWNMPVLSTTVPPPWPRKSLSRARRSQDLGPVDRDVGGVLAPGTTDSRASWTATTPSSSAGTGPRTVLTVATEACGRPSSVVPLVGLTGGSATGWPRGRPERSGASP